MVRPSATNATAARTTLPPSDARRLKSGPNVSTRVVSDIVEADEFAARMDALKQETDKAKQLRLAQDLTALLERDLARATVDVVESIRSHAGDEGAEKALQILRKGVKRVGTNAGSRRRR
jgi:hypothetical protein